MDSHTLPARSLGVIATTLGGVTLTGVVCLSLHFPLGEPFGLLNDLCNGIAGVLSAVLAVQLHPLMRAHRSRVGRLGLIAASLGAIVVGIGSALVIFGITGWFLAGLVSTFGFALIGLWLLVWSAYGLRSDAWPRPLLRLGLVTGLIMSVGLLALTGFPSRIDDPGVAPWFVSASMVSWLGSYLLYPIWALWLGRVFRADHGTVRQPRHA